EYRVFVTDAESCVSVPATTLVDVDDEHGLCVELEPKTAEVCRNNTVDLAAVVSCGKPTEWDLEYHWEPSEQAAELLNATNKDSVVFTPKANGEYTWIVKVVNGDMVAAARATVTVKDADAPLLTLQGRWDCVNDTLVLENSGEAAEKYVWTVDGIETAETGERFVLTDADVKEVRVYAQAANGCLSDTVTIATQLGIIPDVQMSEVAFVNYPDSTHIIRIKQSDGLTEDRYDFMWTSLPDDKINGSRSGLSVLTTPMEEDVKYTFVATSKNNPVCQATDTVWGYMIPKVAAVGIDKDENTGDLYLSWNKEELGLADSVRIMNVKWDGYAVESAYEPLTMTAGEAEKYILNTAKDTLEFFYINASRYIPELGRSYYSLSSDTVGYFKQWAYKNASTASGNQFNFISYPFDMSEKGITTKKDLVTMVGEGTDGKLAISTLAHYDGAKWTVLTALANGNISGSNDALMLGGIYRIVLRNNENLELLLFGKLPAKYIYHLDAQGKYNFVATSLSFGKTIDRTTIGEKILDVQTVGSYKFTEQKWAVSTKANSGAWSGKTGDYDIHIFRPIRVVLKSSASGFDWKY
ncbi:MAG: hypothetical protein K2M86_00530, partial [Odoribacter sp.]|nr:hypothetical protein [Odoribacter sp.]